MYLGTSFPSSHLFLNVELNCNRVSCNTVWLMTLATDHGQSLLITFAFSFYIGILHDSVAL